MKIIYLILFFLVCFTGYSSAQENLLEDAIKYEKEGKYEESVEIINKLIEKNEQNPDYWFFLGLNQRMMKKFDDAYQSQKKVLMIAQNYDDARIEIARIMIVKKDYQKANSYLNNVKNRKNYKDSLKSLYIDIQKRLRTERESKNRKKLVINEEKTNNKTKAKTKTDFFRYQVDIGYEQSKFTRRRVTDWRQGFINFNYKLKRNRVVNFQIDYANRFTKYNKHYTVGISNSFGKNYIGSISVGRTPNSNFLFLPSWRLKSSGEARIIRDFENIGDLWLLADYVNDRYSNFTILVMKYGLRYFINDDLQIEGKIIRVVDENDKSSDGWTSKITWNTFHKPMRVFVGLSSAPETQNAIVVDTKTEFVGLSYNINQRITLHASYTKDDREDSFIRRVYSSAISVKF